MERPKVVVEQRRAAPRGASERERRGDDTGVHGDAGDEGERREARAVRDQPAGVMRWTGGRLAFGFSRPSDRRRRGRQLAARASRVCDSSKRVTGRYNPHALQIITRRRSLLRNHH